MNSGSKSSLFLCLPCLFDASAGGDVEFRPSNKLYDDMAFGVSLLSGHRSPIFSLVVEHGPLGLVSMCICIYRQRGS